MSSLPAPLGSRVDGALRSAVSVRRLAHLELGRPVVAQVLEPRFVAAFAGSWPHADSPEIAVIVDGVARARVAGARVDVALGVEVSDATIASLVTELVSIDQKCLDRAGALRYVTLADRVSAWAQAQAARALAGYVGPSAPADADPAVEARRDRHLRLEVRIARGISDDAAARDIDAARRLDAELAPVRESWSRGEVGSRHVAAFLDRTRLCSPELTTAVLDHLGEKATSTTSSRIGTVINAALAAIDPSGQATRARHARRHEVGVLYRGLPDGLAQIVATHRVEDARAIIDRIDDDADHLRRHRHACQQCATAVPDEIGPARAAAHVRMTLGFTPHDLDTAPTRATGAVGTATDGVAPASGGTTGAGGSSGVDPTGTDAPAAGRGRTRRLRRGELQVVIDLATLLGLAENPALLAGQPVPADIARELATGCGSLRRIVTDPVDGHLLDYGTRTYLPEPLKTHITARDGTCRAPGCHQPAHRCQMDHITPFPHGPSDVANTHALCRRDHITKTDDDLQILEHHPDGTTRWRTRDGQTGITPPRPYLPEPATAPPDAIEELPPF